MAAPAPAPVQPIDHDVRRRITIEVARYLELASCLYKRPFPSIPILFDLKGRVAGMYKMVGRGALWSNEVARCIRFNPWLFAKYPTDSWDNTIPHEAARYVVDCLYGLKNTKPHGVQWQSVMRDFGAQPTVQTHYDLTGIPQRQVKRYTYRCLCRYVELTAYRHQRIVRGKQRYRCNHCSQDLKRS